MAAAIPTAFTATPLLFAAAYVVLQVGRNAASRWLLDDDHALRIVFERILVWSLLSAVFWITGALAPSSWRFTLWGAGLLVEFVAPIAGYWTPGRSRSGTTDYPVDASHFAERFQSFVIIVLGESIVVTGAAASARGLSTSSVFALAVAFLITGGLWWLYFGVVAENSKQHLAKAKDPAVLARDAYSYLHLPIVAGVIMVAVGDDFLVSDATASLSTAGLIMLVGGPALFLAAENMFRLRMIGSINSTRAVAMGRRGPPSVLAVSMLVGWERPGCCAQIPRAPAPVWCRLRACSSGPLRPSRCTSRASPSRANLSRLSRGRRAGFGSSM